MQEALWEWGMWGEGWGKGLRRIQSPYRTFI